MMRSVLSVVGEIVTTAVIAPIIIVALLLMPPAKAIVGLRRMVAGRK
ncbi:MAG: hypothetical protein HQ478_02315 [Chloroflexi bacterium]|nr:hypothetical protein [Chloroflexota bacterium]